MLNNFYFGATFIDFLKGDLNFVPMIISFFRTIVYLLLELIYGLAYDLFNVFELMLNGELLDSAALNEMFGRIGILLGVVMLFRIAFVFIQGLIDPDNAIKDKEKGIPSVIMKAIIVILMFGMSSYVFALTRQVQVLVIKNHVIEKLLLPEVADTDTFGGALTANLFTSFYNLDPELDYQVTDATDVFCTDAGDAGYINQLRLNIAQDKNFSYMKGKCLNAYGNISGTDDQEFLIRFNFVASLLVGILICYFIISYSIQVGMRIIQLAVLQILAPVAFVGYLEPKKEMFNNWLKVYISTYLDVFIRVLIIDFVFYLIALIMEGWNGGESAFWASVGNPSGMTRIWIGIIMIVALFSFALKAPKLITDLFPNFKGSGALSLSPSLKETAAASVFGFGAAALGMGVTAVGKIGNSFRDGAGKVGGFLTSPNKGQAIRDSIKNRANAAKNGLMNPFGTLRSGFARGKRALGNVAGGISNTYGTLKSGWDAGKDKALPFGAIQSGYHSGKFAASQKSNIALQYMNQVDAAIDSVGEIKGLQKQYEDTQSACFQAVAEGRMTQGTADATIAEVKARLDQKRAEVYYNALAGNGDVKVQAAIENARSSGITVPEIYNRDLIEINTNGESVKVKDLEGYIRSHIADYPDLSGLTGDDLEKAIYQLANRLSSSIDAGFKQRKENIEAEGYKNYDPNKK